MRRACTNGAVTSSTTTDARSASSRAVFVFARNDTHKHTRDERSQALDRTFHANAWGGARHYKFPTAICEAAEECLFTLYLEQNTQTTSDVVNKLHTLDPRLAGITRNWVYTTLKKYGWSFKNVSHKQRLKFTSDNTSSAFARVLFCRVVAHRPAWHAAQVDEDLRVTLIKNIPLIRIKYLDEASFVSRGESEDGSCERESKSTTD